MLSETNLILQETYLIIKEKNQFACLTKIYIMTLLYINLSFMIAKEGLVIKSNNLINMQTDLSLIQLKVFTKIIMSTVKNPNAEFYRFSIKTLLDDFNIASPHYTALKKATEWMIKAVVLKSPDREQQLALFTEVDYKNWMVDMYLHPKVKPYILDIKERYTKYFFKSITGLNSIYSMRLYELLKQYEFRKSKNFEIEEFRFILNIWDKYSKYTDFKKRVLLSSQKELKEKTDISFEFEEIRESRKVVRLDFKIITQHKKSLVVSNSLNSNNTLTEQLKTKIFLSDTQIKTVLKQFETVQIERNIDYVLAQKNIKNLAWYFMKSLELDYGQTLFLQEEQKAKERELSNIKIKQQESQEQLNIELEKTKKKQLEQFINSRETEVLELLPSFIEYNKFLLQQSKIDLEDTEELLKIIKWDNREVKGIRSLFMGFISKTVLNDK